jgi:hypothetical protein
MTGDVLKQLLLCIQASEFYALQLDESDVEGLAQLLVYVRFVYGRSIKEDILFCKPLETRTTGEDIFKVLDSFVTSNGLWWSRCVGICTDGAKTMTGRHSGVNCSIHREAGCWVNCSIHLGKLHHLGKLQHPLRGSCCQGNSLQLERHFGHYSENS